jgi:hypothetical protein
MTSPNDRHGVYMSFMDRHGWQCQFLEADLQSIPTQISQDNGKGGPITGGESRVEILYAAPVCRSAQFLRAAMVTGYHRPHGSMHSTSKRTSHSERQSGLSCMWWRWPLQRL